MIIGIDIRSVCGQKAGIGTNFYELVHNLGKIDRTNSYYLYCKKSFEPSGVFPRNFKILRLNVPLFLWHPLVALHARLKKVTFYLTHSNLTALFLKRTQLILYIPDLSGIVLAKYHTFKVFTLSQLYHFAARKASSIITISSYSKNEIASHLKVDRDKIFVTTLAAPPDFRIIENRNDLILWIKKLTLPEKFILFIGSIEPRKNLIGLLNALLHIDSKSRPMLIIAGGQGWKNSEVFKFINEHKLNSYVCILGYVSRDTLIALYNLAEVFVFPSFYEGFGLPVLEAFACGTPVIASNISSIPEVAGNAALYVDPHNTKEIADTILKVLHDPELRKRLVKKGSQQLKNFSWEKNAVETVKIFNNKFIQQ